MFLFEFLYNLMGVVLKFLGFYGLLVNYTSCSRLDFLFYFVIYDFFWLCMFIS